MTTSPCDPWQAGPVSRPWQFHAEIPALAPRDCDDRQSQYVDAFRGIGPNMVATSRRVSADDALATHDVTFAIEGDENKRKFDTLPACEHGIAPSWGRTGETRRSCITRGRKQKWYKDLSLLGWPRLWRWLQCPAAMNGDHCRSLRIWPHRRRPAKGNRLHRQTGHGQASRLVRGAPQPIWGC